MKKKIMFILCTIIILCIGSIVSAATSLTDVKNTKYEDSVNTLITLGLVNGYPEDNTYRPENAVTRAEMAKLMVLSLGEEAKVATAAKGAAKFSDVKSGSWEYGYVNAAADLGIINGYPDGSFGPQNTVSYAEATTMIIRALEYEDEVKKSTEYWPNNYINQAMKLSLYTSVGTINSNDGAKRGNVAILLWNMLRTGVCTAVGQNGTEIVYGEGEKLLNKTIVGFTYYEDALVNDVEFDDTYELANVKMTVGSKTVKLTLDALEAAEMYGQKFNILYNTSSKTIENIEEVDDTTVKEGEITNLTSSKIYIDGGNSSGYKLPDDKNILLYGIDDLEEAATATLVFENSTLKYVIGYAPEKFYLALVTDTEVTVSDKDGIKIINYKETSTKSYALKDEEDMPNVDDIILYYLNSDDELVIIDSTNVFESKEVDTATSTKIKVGSTTYKLSDTLYQIAKVSSSSLKSMSATSIEEDEDSAVVLYFAGERYFIVFIGGMDEAMEQLEKDIDSACSTLSTYIKKSSIKNAYNSETSYTLATYTAFANLYEDATTAINTAQATASVSNLNKVKTIYTDIQSAYNALKLVSSLGTTEKTDETNLINAKRALRSIVNEKKVTDCVSKSGDYTTASYKTFETALKNAKDALRSTTVTQNRIENLTEDLNDALKGLLTKTEDSKRNTALQALEVVIASGEAKKENANSYTVTSYNNLVSRIIEANHVKNDSTSTVEEIETATTNLINAIDLLTNNIEEVSDRLNRALLDAQKELAKTGTYMPETYNALDKAYDSGDSIKSKSNATYDEIENAAKDIEDAIEGLVNVDSKLGELKEKASQYRLDKIKTIASADESTYDKKVNKIIDLENAMNAEDEDINFYHGRLTRYINDAEAIKEVDWTRYEGTFENMTNKLAEAKRIIEIENVTSLELKEACNQMELALKLK